MTVLNCWHCEGTCRDEIDRRCFHCSGTGKLFWMHGRGYPYTPEGEKWAMREEKAAHYDSVASDQVASVSPGIRRPRQV